MAHEGSTSSRSPNRGFRDILQARASDSVQSSTGATIALALTCGALLIMAVGFAFAMCRWRMKYIAIRRKVGGEGMIELKPSRKQNAFPNPQATDGDAAPEARPDGDPAPDATGPEGEAAASGAL